MQCAPQSQNSSQSESQMIPNQCPPCQPSADAATLPYWLEDGELPEHRQYIFQYHNQGCVHFQSGYCPRHKTGKGGQMQCFCYHYESQRRRPLVDSMVGQIRYWDVMCDRINAGEECPMGDMCQFAHTKEEISYHAAKYKTKLCHIKECRGQDVCCFAHGENELRNHAPERYSYWHLCGADRSQQTGNSQEGDLAGQGSSMGALYHPKVYKHRFCASYPDIEVCRRGAACAFAHSRDEIRTALLTEDEEKQEPHALTNEFFMYKFKTLWCPVGVQHDWQSCVYAHNYQDARRHPGIEYGPRPCPYWKRKETSLEYAQRCPLGVRCPYSHGAKEQLYHPAYFKSVTCQDGPSQNCPRGKLCAFWHKKAQQRTQNVGDTDFDYKTPITEDKLKRNLQGDFLFPPFELLSCLQAEVKGMKGMVGGFSPQVPVVQNMGPWGITPHGMVFNYGTGTPTTAADSEEASGGDSACSGSDAMPRNQPQLHMGNGMPAQAVVTGPMGAMFQMQMPPNGGLYGHPVQYVPWNAAMQPSVVYCVPVPAGAMAAHQANFDYNSIDDDGQWNGWRPQQQMQMQALQNGSD